MKKFATLIAVAGILAVQSASATVTTLTFEGACAPPTVTCPIGNFYSGQGITFGVDSLAVNDDESTGSDNNGNFVNNPSGHTIAFFLTGPGDIMNVAAGFTTGFSFFYSSAQLGSVTVFDGLNGTGSQLAMLSLPISNVGGEPCQAAQTGDNPPDFYCNWVPVGVAFGGVAKSAVFSGAANFIGFDNITLGSTNPGHTPEPASLVLLGSGLLGIGAKLRQRLGRKTS